MSAIARAIYGGDDSRLAENPLAVYALRVDVFASRYGWTEPTVANLDAEFADLLVKIMQIRDAKDEAEAKKARR